MNDHHEMLGKANSKAPKFSLLLLLSIVTAFGIAFGAETQTHYELRIPNPTNEYWAVLFSTVRVSATALGLIGLIFFFNKTTRTKRFAIHPGHLLLLIAGISVVAQIVTNFFFGYSLKDIETANWDREYAKQLAFNFQYSKMASMTLVFGINLVGLFRYRWWWKGYFAIQVLAALSAIIATYYFQQFQFSESFQQSAINKFALINSISSYASLGSLFVVVACCIIDLFTKTHRDWMHWFGVFVFVFCYFAITALTIVATRYLAANELFGV